MTTKKFFQINPNMTIDIFTRVDLHEKYGKDFTTKAQKAKETFKRLYSQNSQGLIKHWSYLKDLDIDSLAPNDQIVVMEVVFCKSRNLPIPCFICEDWEFFGALLDL